MSPAGGAAPETWLRAAEAYAGFLARKGKKEEALAVLDQVDEFAAGRLPLIVLRKKIEAGKPSRRLVDGPVDGASRSAARPRHGAQPQRRRSLRAGSICSLRWR